MPVELRKRPPPKETATPAPTAKRSSGSAASTVKKLADKAKAAIVPAAKSGTGSGGGSSKKKNGVVAEPELEAEPESASASAAATAATTTNGAAPATATATTVGTKAKAKAKVAAEGETIDLDGFGGTVQTHDGKDVTLKQLVDESLAGVVIFTYPRASTPGCTTQACLFRDNYAPITGASLSVFGLSTDSPKANTTFVTKQKLPYPLLCDPNATLTSALGLKKPGPGKSTSRGVVVIDKQSNVKVHLLGGPQKTLDVVLDYIKTSGFTETGGPAAVAAPPADDPVATEEAAKLAQPASAADKLDPYKLDEVPIAKTPSKEEAEAAETAAEVSETAAKIDLALGQVKP